MGGEQKTCEGGGYRTSSRINEFYKYASFLSYCPSRACYTGFFPSVRGDDVLRQSLAVYLYVRSASEGVSLIEVGKKSWLRETISSRNVQCDRCSFLL